MKFTWHKGFKGFYLPLSGFIGDSDIYESMQSEVGSEEESEESEARPSDSLVEVSPGNSV